MNINKVELLTATLFVFTFPNYYTSSIICNKTSVLQRVLASSNNVTESHQSRTVIPMHTCISYCTFV